MDVTIDNQYSRGEGVAGFVVNGRPGAGFLFWLLLSLILVSTTSSVASASATYYVSLSGNNNNPGTAAQPFRTIQQAIATAQPGDTIIVKPGTYGPAYAEAPNAHAEWNADRSDGRGGSSGTATARITLKAENPATEASPNQRTILRGNGSGFGLALDGFGYITIDGFEITNFEAGIGLGGNSHQLVLSRNILRSNNGAGIECAFCSDNLFKCNAFLDPGPPYPNLDNAVQDYGLNFYEGSANNTVVHNYFFGKHNQALSWKRKAGPGYVAYNTFEGFMYTAIYLGQNDDESGDDMTSFDIIVEYNVLRDAVDQDTDVYYRGRTPITLRNIQNAVVRYNYIENMFGAAIEVVPCESRQFCNTVAGRRPVGAKIYGNTIVNSRTTDPHSGENSNAPGFEIIGRGYQGDTIEIYNNTMHNMNRAFLMQEAPNHVSNSETDDPPTLIIKNNNLINVNDGVDGITSTSTFAYNNWYELDNPAIDNRQDETDTHLDPRMVGPLTIFDPFAVKGPNPIYSPDFSGNQAYKLRANSQLIDAGIDVGLPFEGNAPDIGANEFAPTTVPMPTATTTTPGPITTTPTTPITTTPMVTTTPTVSNTTPVPTAPTECSSNEIYKVYLPILIKLSH